MFVWSTQKEVIYNILRFYLSFTFDIVFAVSFWCCLGATWPSDLIFLLVIRSITHNNAFVFNYFGMYACVCMSFILFIFVSNFGLDGQKSREKVC